MNTDKDDDLSYVVDYEEFKRFFYHHEDSGKFIGKLIELSDKMKYDICNIEIKEIAIQEKEKNEFMVISIIKDLCWFFRKNLDVCIRLSSCVCEKQEEGNE